ncbi:threonine-phosphate decarboxylase CobD [Oceanobacillus sp. CAU 1775]
MNWPAHGSNPQYIYQYLNMEIPKDRIDFSVNVNPFGSPTVLQEKWTSWFPMIEDYPDPKGNNLISLLAKIEKIDKQSVLLGNGGAEIIHLLANYFKKKRVLLIQPTFSEYEKMCRAYDCEISYFTLEEPTWEISLEALVPYIKQNDVVFLCHPNNPTGMTYSKSLLLKILDACKKEDCYLVIDEAFYDFMNHPLTLVSSIETYKNLIIIRSLTKMYAIAGLRLGYMMASPQVIEDVKKYQPHWSVNAIALLAGEESLKEEKFVQETRNFFSEERARLLTSLKKAGYLVSNSSVNYYLLRDPNTENPISLFKYLLKKGYVPRHTANYPGLDGRWFRFAIRKRFENDLLLEALYTWKNQE